MTSETAFAGWVRKSHLGRPLEPSSGGLERWLVLDGFHVAYFKDNSLAKRHGRFDLRNVMSAGPSADPNAADAEYGSTPLHLAATLKADDLIRDLVAAGADPGLARKNGENAEEIYEKYHSKPFPPE